MDIIRDIENFVPLCPQEQRDKTGILRFLAGHPDAFDRENLTAHMTASAWVLSPDRRQVVMVYHNSITPGPGPADTPTGTGICWRWPCGR
ncbi:MAG: hypothetical protein ACLUYM_05335 [Oscillospiraceae bacterium]